MQIKSLQDAFEVQKSSQVERGFNFPMTGETRAAYIKTQTLHCIDELCEMLHEVKGYKEWKRYDYTDEATNATADVKATEELVDAFHFFMNIALALGISAEYLLAGYAAKQQINEERLMNTAEYKKDTEE